MTALRDYRVRTVAVGVRATYLILVVLPVCPLLGDRGEPGIASGEVGRLGGYLRGGCTDAETAERVA